MFPINLLTTPWLPSVSKTAPRVSWPPSIWRMKTWWILPQREQICRSGLAVSVGIAAMQYRAEKIQNWEDIWFDGLHADALHKALAPLEHAFQFGAETPSLCRILNR